MTKPKTVPVFVRLPEDSAKKLKKLAAHKRTSQGKVLDQLIQDAPINPKK